MSEVIDSLVVGAGPGGLVAGLYLQRFHRRVRIVDAGAPRAAKIPRSYNCPGFPEGITGEELLQRLREQLRAAGGAVQRGCVQALRQHDAGFEAQVDGQVLLARTVVLATGVVDREPALPGVDEVRAHGLLRQCPICDGHESSGKQVGIIGSGPHGVWELLFLRHYTPHLCFVALRGPQDVDPDVAELLRRKGFGCVLGPGRDMGVTADGRVRLRMADGREQVYDLVYAALGVQPRSQLAREAGADLDKRGNVKIDRHGETSVPGLYAIGDVASGLDQLAVAFGQAALATTAIHNRLSREE